MTLIEQQGLVVAVAPGLAWVDTPRRSACGGCASRDACATPILGSLAGGGQQASSHRIQVADPLGLRAGDRVTLGVPDGDLTRAAALAYLTPPAALVLVAAAAAASGAGDLGSALAGLLGLGLGLGLTRLLTDGAGGRWSCQPVLVRREPAVAGQGTFKIHQTHERS